MSESVRIDKWLWAVRIFKTRALAAKACSNGKVTINGSIAKPARQVRIGDVVKATTAEITRTVRARAPVERRVGASLVAEYCEDLTSPEDRVRREVKYVRPVALRPKGKGRPTKRDRRSLESFFNQA